ncbi:MAG: nucleotidyltransferase family protein [Clostridia bacterium]|nr:nucleotidyltransferase family protein [Clostridia bacterium]
MEWIDPYNDIINLLWCSINDIKPESSYLCGSDWSELIKLCKIHKITALVNIAVSKADDDVILPEIKQSFNKEYLKAVRVNILFDAESGRIFRLFKENHICNLPLKGCVLKDYYPETFLRQMGDIDVLILPQDSIKVKELMTESGYECKTYGISRHDEYFKKPFYTYEIHRNLFHESNDVRVSYYHNIFDRLIKKSADSYEYRFSKEDLYIYFFSARI